VQVEDGEVHRHLELAEAEVVDELLPPRKVPQRKQVLLARLHIRV
jgi:hypothetical protein